MTSKPTLAPLWADVVKELYDLSPWEKLVYYHKIPWKLLFHVMLTFMMSLGVFTDATYWSSYMLSSQENFCHFFFPASCVDSVCGASHSMLFEECRVYSVDDVYDNIQSAVNNYYDINNTALSMYEYVYDKHGDIEQPKLVVQYRPDPNQEKDVKSKTYRLSPDDLGPLSGDPDSVTQFYESMKAMHLEFPLEDEFRLDYHRGRYRWNVRIHYTSHDAADILVTTHSVIDPASTKTKLESTGVNSRFFWTQILIIVLGATYLGLLVKDMFESYFILDFVRSFLQSPAYSPLTPQHAPEDGLEQPKRWLAPESLYSDQVDRELPEWEDVPWSIRIRFFNVWIPAIMFATVSCIWSAAWSLRPDGALPSDVHNFFQGLGAAILWVTMLAFLRYNSKLYAIVLILQGSLRRVVRVLSNILPIFVGVSLLAMMLYGSELFSFGRFGLATMTLFSFMNGDVVEQTLTDARSVSLFGPVYLILFFFAFNYIVLRVILAMIESTLWYLHLYSVTHRKRMNWRAQKTIELGMSVRNRAPANSLDSGWSIGELEHFPDSAEKAFKKSSELLFQELLEMLQAHHSDALEEYFEERQDIEEDFAEYTETKHDARMISAATHNLPLDDSDEDDDN